YFTKTGDPVPPPGTGNRAIFRAIGPAYFRTLGIRMTAGREFQPADVQGSPRVAIINAAAVQRVFGGDNPVGRDIDLLPARARWTNHPGTLRIVGVATNVKEVGMNEVEFLDI